MWLPIGASNFCREPQPKCGKILDNTLPITIDMQLSQTSAPSTLLSRRTSEQLAPQAFAGRPSTLVYGAFKAMGDILNASPVIASQLDSAHKVKLLIFPSPALPEFIQLIDFGRIAKTSNWCSFRFPAAQKRSSSTSPGRERWTQR